MITITKSSNSNYHFEFKSHNGLFAILDEQTLIMFVDFSHTMLTLFSLETLWCGTKEWMFFIRRRDQFHVWLIMRRLSRQRRRLSRCSSPNSSSTTPQRNNSTHNKSVWKTASTPDTGRDRFQTGFKERGQQVHLTYIISCFSKSKFWLIGCFWLFLMIFDGLQNGESCGEKVEEIACTSNLQRASVILMIAFGFLIFLDFKLIN